MAAGPVRAARAALSRRVRVDGPRREEVTGHSGGRGLEHPVPHHEGQDLRRDGLVSSVSEQVPLWAVLDVDVRQNVMQRGKNIGDVAVMIDTVQYPGHSGSELLLDNVEDPHGVRDLLSSPVSEARAKKQMLTQTQYLQHSGPAFAAPPAPAYGASPTAAPGGSAAGGSPRPCRPAPQTGRPPRRGHPLRAEKRFT